ncbi:hypothetical protein ABZ379_26430 [Streptomyces canus]|uniref:hypothetical protein n=1 Tax=Streptomyces canus TaxID=58343 RepID=UPI0033EFF38B
MSMHEKDRGQEGFSLGSPELRSVGPVAFTPDGVLFVADNVQAEILAFDLSSDDRKTGVVEIDGLDERLAAFLGCAVDDVHVRDLAVHPLSRALYLSVMRGAGESAVPLVIRVGDGGELSQSVAEDVRYARMRIDDAPAADDEREEASVTADSDPAGEWMDVPQVGITLRITRASLRGTTVTDLAFVNGELLVAGASNEEFVSTLRRIPFPFRGEAQASSLEIFHVSHGAYETHSPIRAFVPYGGGTGIVASYTCTPLVHFPLSDLTGQGTRAVGRTVADLGAASSPLDIVSFTQGGDEYLLVSNARLPLMKIACKDIDAQEALTEPRESPELLREPAGVPLRGLPHEGVSRMAVTDGHVLMLQRDDSGLHLRAHSTASP